VDTPFWTFAWWIMLGRVGSGLMAPALNAGALRALPYELLAQGSGAINFVRQLGGALGVDLIAVAIDRRTAFHGTALAEAQDQANQAAGAAVQQLTQLLAHWGNPFGHRLATAVPPAAGTFLEAMMLPQARTLAYQDGFMLVAVLFFLTLVPALLMPRQRPA
jgi:hypothetical protein